MKRNVKMAGLVVGVSVAAVVAGALVAAQQTPELASATGDATPIGGSGAPVSTPAPSIGTPKPTPKPSPPPSKPSAPVTDNPAGPAKVELDLTKLSQGKGPDAPYADGRTVHSRQLLQVDLPTSDGTVDGVVRAGTGVLVLHRRGDGRGLLTHFSGDGIRGKTVRDVYSLRSSADSTSSAYAVAPVDASGNETGTVLINVRDNPTGKTSTLTRKGEASPEVLAVDGGTVYYSSEPSGSNGKRGLYRWTVGQSGPETVGSVPRPTAVSPDGSLVASLVELTDGGSCTALVEVSSAAKRWRTCDYQVDELRTDRDYVVGGPAYRDGYADGLASALDAKTGKLIREWSGLSFIATMMEDDQHMLMLVENDTHTAIVRCAPRTGKCELATPLKKGTGQQEGPRPYALGH